MSTKQNECNCEGVCRLFHIVKQLKKDLETLNKEEAQLPDRNFVNGKFKEFNLIHPN
jgi:hypothetical protein